MSAQLLSPHLGGVPGRKWRYMLPIASKSIRNNKKTATWMELRGRKIQALQGKMFDPSDMSIIRLKWIRYKFNK